MSNRRTQSDFAALFKKYRLKSQIETLSEFGDLLAEEGYIYENSLFTRWQNGQRIPRDKKLLVTIIELFAKKGGLKDEYEANLFLESADQRDLTEDEILHLNQYFHVGTQTLPEEIDIFVGREQIIKDVSWILLDKQKVLLYGPPGIGKTAIGIRIGHLLIDKFPDGVFWFRPDIKKPDMVLDEVMRMLGVEDAILNSFDKKLRRLNQITKNKSILLILDNVQIENSVENDFQQFLNLNFAILTTSTQSTNDISGVNTVYIPYFNENEYMELAEKILGKPYVISNKKDIAKIGTLLGFLPITSSMILKQIFLNPTRVKNYIYQIENSTLLLEKMNYDNKNLYSSLEICYKQLDGKLQKVLSSCSIFEGNDFDIKAIAFINNLNIKETKECIEKLIIYSFINLSINTRYRINPTVKLYLQTKIEKEEISTHLVSFYDQLYKGEILGDKVPFDSLNLEIDNILGLIKTCFKLKRFKEIVKLWQHIHTYLWLSGKWNIILNLDSLMQKSFTGANDQRALGYYLVEDLGRVNFFQHQIEKALQCLIKAKKIAEMEGDICLKGLIFQKYGVAYTEQGNFKNAEEAFKQSLFLLKKNLANIDLVKTQILLGSLLTKKKNYSLAIKYLHKALKTSKDSNIEDTLGMCYIYLGNLYLQREDYTTSEEYYKKGIVINKELKRKIGLVLSYDGLANIAKVRGELSIAVGLFKLAIKMYDELGMKIESNRIRANKYV